MDANIIMEFVKMIPSNLYIIAGALYVLGFIIKQSKIPNEYIVFILLGVSIILSLAIGGLNIYSVIYGIILSVAPVFVQNVIKQGMEIANPKKEA